MNNVTKMVNDAIGQIELYKTLNKPNTFIGVYTARQNLIPFKDGLREHYNTKCGTALSTWAQLQEFIKQYLKVTIEVWQKPDPFNDESNHLLLTVGGLTAVIFDYTEST